MHVWSGVSVQMLKSIENTCHNSPIIIVQAA